MDAEVRGPGNFRQKLQRFPGVDCASAIARLAGNEALYCELLEMFFEQNFAGRLRAALAAKDAQRAALEAHSLKGTAANLGFKSLSSTAASLEQAFRAGDFACAKDAFAAFEEEYGELYKHML